MYLQPFHFLSNFDLENNSTLNYGPFRYNLFYYPVCVCGFKCANLFTAFLDCLSNISIYYQLINVHQERTTQKHWQHCAHKEQDENKQEFIINTKHFNWLVLMQVLGIFAWFILYIIYTLYILFYLDTTPLQRGQTSAGYQSLRLIIINKQLYKM
jgi:hypothetical protein